MAGQTKMIFITSDEDLVRQLSINKTANTHVIDLNNDEQVTLVIQDKNKIVNYVLPAKLSGLNSNNDQIHKTALASPNHNRSKRVKVSKKSTDLVCTICGDRAIGFNYDVLSCASCKAFFYRYAGEDSTSLKCLAGQSQCVVESKTSRKCHRCRLERCFVMGMRKDFILSQEEKQRRKKGTEENRSISSERSSTASTLLSISNSLPNPESLSQTLDEIDHLSMDVQIDNGDSIVLHQSTDSAGMENTLLEPLTAEDLVVIHNIQSSFTSIFENQCEEFSDLVDLSDRASALISWSQFGQMISLRLISFFRLVDEFESLDDDDRFILIKYHLPPLYPVLNCYMYRSINDCCSYGEHEEAQKKRRFFMLCDESRDVYEMFINLILFLVEITEQDQVLLSLLLIILLFSQGLSVNADQPLLYDSLSVHRFQSYYTKVLWNYLVNKHGETKASKKFIQLLRGIFRIQSVGKIFQEFIRFHIATSNTVDRIAPLMQTVLHIS